MPNQPSRRRVLSIGVGGAGTALTLTGCSSSGDPGPDRPNQTEPKQTSTTDRQPGDDAEDLATVTLSVEIPEAELESAREEFNQRQQELEDELEDGEISQQEFQARAQRARDESGGTLPASRQGSKRPSATPSVSHSPSLRPTVGCSSSTAHPTDSSNSSRTRRSGQFLPRARSRQRISRAERSWSPGPTAVLRADGVLAAAIASQAHNASRDSARLTPVGSVVLVP